MNSDERGQRADLEREAEERALGERMQPAVAQHVGGPRRAASRPDGRRCRARGRAPTAAGFCTSSESGPPSIDPAVEPLGGDDAAGAIAGLEHARRVRPRRCSSYAAASPAMPPPTMATLTSRCPVPGRVPGSCLQFAVRGSGSGSLRFVDASRCTYCASICTCSTGVDGRMPWPRLKMWPGRPPTRARMSSACWSMRGDRAEQQRRIEVALHGAVVRRCAPTPRRSGCASRRR